jgi:hypothetical protein
LRDERLQVEEGKFVGVDQPPMGIAQDPNCGNLKKQTGGKKAPGCVIL